MCMIQPHYSALREAMQRQCAAKLPYKLRPVKTQHKTKLDRIAEAIIVASVFTFFAICIAVSAFTIVNTLASRQ